MRSGDVAFNLLNAGADKWATIPVQGQVTPEEFAELLDMIRECPKLDGLSYIGMIEATVLSYVRASVAEFQIWAMKNGRQDLLKPPDPFDADS